MLLDRSYFELQAQFATRAADLEDLALAEAFRLHTAFYALARDNDAGVAPARNDFDPAHPNWASFVEALEDGVDPVDYMYEDYLGGDARQGTGRPCFEFAYWPEDRLVRIHFSNDAKGTALRPSAVEDRHRELSEIFRAIAREHPEASTVRGTSWLYHVGAYRRLFPPRFVAALTSAGYPHQFAALWAQFIDRHGVVKPLLAAAFRERIEQARTPAQLEDAFPLDVLAATVDIDVFYDHFGVER